jgi:archaemetzincin
MHRFVGVVLAAGFVMAVGQAEAAAAKPVVCLQPLGDHDARALPVVARGITYLYGLEVRTLAARPLPDTAWYAPRRRHRAEKILAHLDRTVVPGSGCDLVMGWTRADISTTKGRHQDWGLLGYAWINGPSGVVSSYRMGGVSRIAMLRRAVKVVNHELGHALGLRHDAGCLMSDLNGTVKALDREAGLLCDDSRRSLEVKHGIALPLRGWFDWSALK